MVIMCVACRWNKRKPRSMQRECIGEWYAYRYDPGGDPIQIYHYYDDSTIGDADISRYGGGPSKTVTHFRCSRLGVI